MRQSKITATPIAVIVSLLLFSTTVAVAAGSSSIKKIRGTYAPKVVSLTSFPVSTTAFLSRHKRSPKELCKTRKCKRREWLKHHPRPRYPSSEALSSEYGNGDGFLGGHLACGGEYKAENMGVANKSLPCGTQLRMCYPAKHPQHCAQVEVQDRGPYSGGREFDLQIRPAAALGFSGVGTVSWEVVHHT